MNTKIYIALAATAVFTIGIFGGAAWSDHKVRTLEKAVAAERERAARLEETAAAKEQEAASYREKIEYLERQIAGYLDNHKETR